MKFKYLFLSLLSLLVLSACSNDDDFLFSDTNVSELTRSETFSLKYPMSSFISKISLNTTDQNTVNGYLSDMQNEFGKWYLPLFVKLKSNPIAEIKRGSTGTGSDAPAAYYANQNILAFLTGADIRYNGVCEELIHAGQQRIYPGGIAQYGKKKGTPNIEFEAKLAQDLVSCINDLPFNLGEGADNSTEYVQWILELCGDGSYPSETKVLNTEVKSMGYYQMVISFGKKYAAYNYPVIMDLKPLYINYISDSI